MTRPLTVDEEVTLLRFLGYPRMTSPAQRLNRAEQRMRILRIALAAIVATPELTLDESRQIAWQAIWDTE